MKLKVKLIKAFVEVAAGALIDAELADWALKLGVFSAAKINFKKIRPLATRGQFHKKLSTSS